ncbi:MAG: hypothetical protein Alpg2KO_15510 [Alphaproteobacteria bacterium]
MMKKRIQALAIGIVAILGTALVAPVEASRGGYEDYLRALSIRESSGDFTVINGSGYMGGYQIGEAALVDIGWVSNDGNAFNNNYRSYGWTSAAGAYGVRSYTDFINNRQAQEYAIRRYNQVQWGYIGAKNLYQYVGTTVNGILMTESGMLAGAHLVGAGALSQFLKSNGRNVPRDGNNTPITHYISKFNGYDTPFGSAGEGIDADDPIFGDPGALPDGGGAIHTGSGAGGRERTLFSDGGVAVDDEDSFYEWAGMDHSGGAGENGYYEYAMPCAPVVEDGITEAATSGFEHTRSGVAKDILQPASVTLASCLDDILNSGLSIFVQFKPPNLKDLVDGIANRICDKMNDVFEGATKDLTDSLNFEQFGIKMGVRTRVRKGQDSAISVSGTFTDFITGDRDRRTLDIGEGNRGLSDDAREDPIEALRGIME